MIPNLSVLWVVFFVLILVGVLDRLLFTPVLRVMREREGAIVSARDLATVATTRATAAANEFEIKTTAARSDVYRQMDEKRRAAMERRADLLAQSRQEAESAIEQARARLRADAADARARLASEADQLGAIVAARVLGRDPTHA